jgi:hypothetical protein
LWSIDLKNAVRFFDFVALIISIKIAFANNISASAKGFLA